MLWKPLSGLSVIAPMQGGNYSLINVEDGAGERCWPIDISVLTRPYAEFFAYGGEVAAHPALLMEQLLRLETCSAALDRAIAPLWRDLVRVPLTMAEDGRKQRIDRLFGLDGEAGLLGALKRYRLTAANHLARMPCEERDRLLDTLFMLAGRLLPDRAGPHLWPAGEVEPAAWLALPLYLQALALITLVRGWADRAPSATEAAEIRRHVVFLTGERLQRTVGASACTAAAEALMR